MVQYLVEKGLTPVLAIDADPDSNLGTLLGHHIEQSVGELRDEVLKKMKDFPAGMTKASYMEAGLHEIIEESKGYDLITMGKGEGSGCYCYLNSLIRKFQQDLTPSYKYLVMDNEAGLEHISRRTTSNVDVLIMVVSGNPISLNTAKTIAQITKDLKNKIGKLYVVTNRVKPGRLDSILQWASGAGIEHLGDVPEDDALDEAIYNDGSIINLNTSTARESIFSMMAKLIGG
jgi:CO dehydrogenase maturation factor